MIDRTSGVISEIAAHAAEDPASALAPAVDSDPAQASPLPDAAQHDHPQPVAAAGSASFSARAVSILAVLALLYSLYFAREFLIPIMYAVLLSFLLSPAVRAMARWKVPPPLSAALLVLGLLGALGVGAYALAGPVQRWIATAPESLDRAETKLHDLVRPMQQVSRTVERATSAVGDNSARQPQVVVAAGPSISSRIFGTTERIIAAILEIVILLYFLLAGGDLFLQKLIKVLPDNYNRATAVEIARGTEAAVSAFLSTALLVNVAEGILVAGALFLIGMPNAPMWGVMVALFEFVPYLGALAAVVVLTVAGLTTFDSVGGALLAPGSFLAINLIQANLVSPLLLGHRLTLNPVAIFVGLAFFFWIWGVPGAFLAVPLLATMKIFCDHIASLAALGEFLGQRDVKERRRVVRA